MKQALVFPGQGSQFVSMGKDFAENFKAAKLVFEEVDDALGEKLSDIIFEGPSNQLTLTKNTQPALMATSIAIFNVLKQETGFSINQLAGFVAGHSLGEYTALCAAGSLSLADTAKLLRIRGEAMQQAVPEGQGAMAAILGMEFNDLEKLCQEITKEYGLCQIANDNCPGQIVISGVNQAINKAVEMIKNSGKKAILLSVSAPFHCQLIEPVKPIMQQALAKVTMKIPQVPLIANVTADIVTDPQQIKIYLIEQVTAKVRWRESINYLIEKQVDTIIEIGAGKVLTGLAKRIDKTLNAFAISTIDELKNYLSGE